MAHYLDTSALVKLVVAEPETEAFGRWLHEVDSIPISSDLARSEVMRAVQRSAPDLAPHARTVLDSIALLKLTPATFEEAGRLHPHDLRSLDAIHLAAALELGDDLESIVTYDDRLATAARQNGIRVTAPA